MGYERYPQNSSAGDYYHRPDPDIQGRDYGSGRDYSYSSARDYQAAGAFDRDRGAPRGGYDHNRDYGRDAGGRDLRREAGVRGYGRDDEYRGSYGAGGRRYLEDGRERETGSRDYGRQPQGYDYEDRGFLNRAGDEVRSWFGDEEAERRRAFDARYDERNDHDRYANAAYGRDDDYHQWRRSQIDSLDRDYEEYRQENRSKFENEFGTWRSERQTQRGALSKVEQHAEVVGSDGQHIGTVDKVRGDRLILTKNDADAGGHHHSIPSRWIESADAKQVKVRKTAEEAKAHWRDEERSNAFFNEDKGNRSPATGDRTDLNRSFSGTY